MHTLIILKSCDALQLSSNYIQGHCIVNENQAIYKLCLRTSVCVKIRFFFFLLHMNTWGVGR